MAQKDKKPTRSPFFVRFLEAQEFPRVKSDVKAGGKKYTMKYPSDNDEDGLPA